MCKQADSIYVKNSAKCGIVLCLLGLALQTEGQNDVYEVAIDLTTVLEAIDEKFVGVTLDSGLIRDRWVKFNFSSPKLKTLAKGLSPSYVRIGGTAADELTFEPSNAGIGEEKTPWSGDWKDENKLKNFTMSGTDWININKFSSSVGWKILFDFNVLKRDGNIWDTRNALQLLNFSAAHGFQLAGFELGNEPNAFRHVFDKDISARTLARDFGTLRRTLDTFPQFRTSTIVGPDVTRLVIKNSREYFDQFLNTGGGKVVNKATFHHYYMDGRTATIDDFTDPNILDNLLDNIAIGQKLVKTCCPGLPLWIGETATAYGGGAEGLSDAYVAGFMWLDKLGLSAKLGVKGVLRQSFYKGGYALLDEDTLDPNPDYWLTLLYKRFVGNLVFNVTTSSQAVRMYAHCTNVKSGLGYQPGSLTVYVVNIKQSNVTLSFEQFQERSLHIFWLTPAGSQDLRSRKVNLNDKTLQLMNNNIPPLYPSKTSSHEISVPGKTFGFIVIPDADIPACKKLSK